MLFTNKRKTTALYKGLSSEYRDKLDLAEIYDSAVEIVEKYQISTFPMLVAVNMHLDDDDLDLEMKIYEGKLNFNNIGDWLDGYALDEKAAPFERKTKKEYST
jgi:protein disulfide-isomerase A6